MYVRLHVKKKGDFPFTRTTAVDLGHGLYEILPTREYDPEYEKWEFIPGTIVRGKNIHYDRGDYFVAVEQVEPSPFTEDQLKWYPENTARVYIELLEEGTDTIRPTRAVTLGERRYALLPTPGYDPENETWAFLPGAVVKAEEKRLEDGTQILLAVEQVG